MFLENRKQQNLKKITAIALAVLFLDQIIKFIIVKNIFFTMDIYKNYNALFGLPIDFILILFIFLILSYYFIFRLSKNCRFNPESFRERNLCAFVYRKLTKVKDFSLRSAPFKMTKSEFLYSLAFGLILGGIAGNLTDRFFYGYIIDYIKPFDLFVFNIADLAICFGALLLSWKILKK